MSGRSVGFRPTTTTGGGGGTTRGGKATTIFGGGGGKYPVGKARVPPPPEAGDV